MMLKIITPEQEKASLPFMIAYGSDVYEADCLPALVAAVVGKEYMDVKNADTAWHVRVDALREIAAYLGAQGVRAIVRDNVNLLADNAVVPDEEKGELDEITWRNYDAPVVLWASTDRTFIQSLLEAKVIAVAERSDCYILRKNGAWTEAAGQECGKCLYYDRGKCAAYGFLKAESDGAKCAAFAPVHEGWKGMSYPTDDYVVLQGRELAEQFWITDREALEERRKTGQDKLNDFTRWWEGGDL